MSSNVEQISRHERSTGYRRFVKKQTVRKARRLARRDPEAAPPKVPRREYTS